jgi:hypothetical protein
MRTSLLFTLLLAGCQGESPTCDDQATCAAVCPEVAGARLATFPDGKPNELSEAEWAVFGPEIVTFREGPKPAFENGIGLASGPNAEQRLPAEAGALPPGRWRLRADLLVPSFGGFAWAAEARQTCVTQIGAADDASQGRDQGQEVREVSWESPVRPTVWDGLFPIESPSTKGSQRCAWEMEFKHGVQRVVYRGKFEVPAADPKAAVRAPTAPPSGAPPGAPTPAADPAGDGQPPPPQTPPSPPAPPPG